MHLSFAVFADAANLSQEGKLNVMGVFDALQVGGFPAVHPRATLVVRLKGGSDDIGTHALVMRWVNPRGQELWNSEGQIEIGNPPPGVFEMDLPLIAQIDLPLDGPGRYSMAIAVDGVQTAELPIHVRAATTGMPVAGRPPGLVS